MGVIDRFRGKRVLLTGTTGFLGKVVLEKMLFSIPEIDKIYVLIRGKQGSRLQERFKKEIVSSACFDRLRAKYQFHFDEFIQNKVYPIEGDLLKSRVGLNEEDYNEIIQNCNVIVNSAASIDFNARLDDAIAANITGSLQMMKLAAHCKQLEIFTHISTCYVGCIQSGLIKQDINLQGFGDPLEQYQNLLKTPVKDLITHTSQIIGKYPNTYTFTKSLTQRIMKCSKGDLPLCIVRPAIINAAYDQPVPGWLDSIAAAQAYFMFAGLGVITQGLARSKGIGDVVPVDIVTANIIVATAINMNCRDKLNVYHVGSSDLNPVTWGLMRQVGINFWNSHKSSFRAGPMNLIFTQSPSYLKYLQMKREMPFKIYSKVAPYLGKTHVKLSSKMVKTVNRGQQVAKLFQFFTMNQFIFQMRKVKQLQNFMTQDQRKIFIVDISQIDMNYFILLSNYGLQKYILKDNIELSAINGEKSNLFALTEDKTYFSDIKWALSFINPHRLTNQASAIQSKILSSTHVLASVQKQIQRRLQKITANSEKHIIKITQEVKAQAKKIAEDMVGQVRLPVVRFMAWIIHKIFRQIYEKINVNIEMFQKLRQIQHQKGIPIVLLPNHRSYIDFLIVSYIFFAYRMKLPYIITDQAMLQASLLPFLIRSSGAFFYRKKYFKSSELYRAIFSKYVQLLLINGQNIQLFLQGSRSRTGKILQPSFDILNVILDSVSKGKINDVCLVPITINYEKVLEGDTFPSELLGQDKIQESFLRIIKAIPLLKANFGRVYVEMCEPLYAKQAINTIKGTIEQKSFAIGRQIMGRLQQKIIIMSTGIVSAVLLQYRRGISEDILVKSVNWISKYIISKGFKIGGINQHASTITIRNAIHLLDQIILKTKKSIFQIQISAATDFNKILMLSYYRNTIIHAFLPQAFISCALMGFGDQLNRKQGVQNDRLKEKTLFLYKLLNKQFLLSNINVDFYEEKLMQMRNGRTLQFIFEGEQSSNARIQTKNNFKVVINVLGQKVILFQYSLLRALLECYWACLMYLLALSRSDDKRQDSKSTQQFFNMVQWYIESLYEQKVIDNYEACSLQTIKNAFTTFTAIGLVAMKQNKKQSTITVANQQILGNYEADIKFFLKNIYLNPVAVTPMGVSKASLMDSKL